MAKPTVPQLAETPKEAFGDYIRELEDDYYGWYAKASNRNKVAFVILQGTAILAGTGTAVVAALVKELEALRLVLVLLPLLGTFVTALLAQTRVREVLAIRELGREQVQRLISDAKAEYAATSANADMHFTQLHKKLIADVSHIERQQALNALSIIQAPIPK